MKADICTILADYITYKIARRFIPIPIYITWYRFKKNNDTIISYNNGIDIYIKYNYYILFHNSYKYMYMINKHDKHIKISFIRDRYETIINYYINSNIQININKYVDINDKIYNYDIYIEYYLDIYNNYIKTVIEYSIKNKQNVILTSEQNNVNIADIAKLVNNRLKNLI